ncbi:putative aminopeptidase, Iap family [Halolamina pelagica]|uniref:Carboxypeptidase Q n=1 Tax=Halolamina pelagica TaxID=699431 RepID=A0A0P7FUF2_9EURY|nr:M28 family peptidase [Halolamina pelagica]KPN30416.1 putative aminopeptidase, Iap family [Halolamina pelagica]
MVHLPDAVVGDAQTSLFAWNRLEELVDVGNRMAGQQGEAAGAEIIHEAFEDAGLRNPRIEEFEIPGWWRGDASLTVESPHERTHDGSHQVVALPGTPAGEASAPIVDVGDGTYEEFEAKSDDLDGAIAMASSDTPEHADRWLHRMEKYVNAADHGAVAFVFRNHIEGALPPTGEVGYNNRPGPIPAVGVSKEVGARLERYAAEDDCEVTVDVDCRNEPATSRNVEALVGPEGPDEGGEADEVLVTAHVDGHDIADGANDNGAGSVLVAEVGRLLSQVEDDLDSRVRLVTFGSEEIGLRGAYHCAETTDLSNVKCVINLDGACSSRNLRVGTNGFGELGELFRSVADDFDAPISTGDTISPHGDQWAFVQEGVPATMTGTTSNQSGRGWGHTHADTLDKLDSRDLRDVATLVTEAVYRAARDGFEVEARSREETRDAIDEGYVQELKMGGRWPYEDDN